MSTVLVTHASRMGSTREIAEVVATDLRRAGHQVVSTPCDGAPPAREFDAVVIGSALYVQRWLGDAVQYLRENGRDLSARPTWLFQSGPCGESGGDTSHTRTPRSVHRLVRAYGLEGPVTFGGRLDAARTQTRLERWVATGTPAGDYRDWDAIHAWAGMIDERLRSMDHRPAEEPDDPEPDPAGGGSDLLTERP